MPVNPDYNPDRDGPGHYNDDGSFVYPDGTVATVDEINAARSAKGLPPLGTGEAAGQDAQAYSFDQQNTPDKSIGKLLGFSHSIADPGGLGASLDTSNQDRDRELSDSFVAQLQQRAAQGGGAWEGVLANNTARASDSAQAIGQSRPGVGYASALHDIGNAQAGIGERAAGQAVILRNQSKLSAQHQLTDLLGGTSSMDAAQAADAASARQGVREANNAAAAVGSQNLGNFAKGVGQAAAMMASDGGAVPGAPKVFGDDSRNDTVPAMLSPGEIVIPRSHATSPEAAADFVRALQASRGGVQHLAEGGSAWNRQPGNSDPGIMTTGTNLFGGDVQAPSVDNGALLDTRSYDQNRRMQGANARALGQQAGGQGPSVAPQEFQNATDNSIAAALGAVGRGAASGDILRAVGADMQGAGGRGAETAASEQAAGGSSFIRALLAQRAQDQALAVARQQAEFRNTQMNMGLDAAHQSAVKGVVGGVGQGMTTYAGMGSKGGGGSDFSGSDKNLPVFDQGFGPGGSSAGSNPDEWANPYAHGGEVGDSFAHALSQRYAGGGQIPAWAEKTESAKASAEKENAEFFQRRWDAKREEAKASALKDNVQFSERRAQRFAEGGGVELPADGGAPLPPQATMTPDGGYAMPTRILGGEAPIQDAAGGVPPVQTPGLASFNPPASNWTPPESHGSTTHWEAPKEAVPPAKPPRAPPEPGQPAAPKPPAGTHAGATRPTAAAGPTKEEEAVNALTHAKEQEARDQVKMLAAQQDEATAQGVKQQRDIQESQAYGKSMLVKHQAVLDDMAKMDDSVDPGRFWASRSTPQKIAGIIGLALGAVGTGPDGVNRAAQMLNTAIDRDIDAQKAEHEIRLKRGMTRAAGYQAGYAMAHELTGDNLAAADLAKSTALAKAENQMKQILATSAVAQANPNGQLLLADMQMKRKAAEADAQLKMSEAYLAQKKAAGGSGGIAPAEAKSLHEAEAATQNAMDYITRIKSGLRKTASSVPGGTAINQNFGADSAALKTDATGLMLELKNAAKLGVLSKSDENILDKLQGDPTAVFTREGTKMATLNTLESMLQRSIANQRASVMGGRAAPVADVEQ
jgi:hypothetical protein